MNVAWTAHWREARRHEAAGDLPAAKAEYQAILAIEPTLVVPHLRLSRFAQMSGRYVDSHAHALEAARVALLSHVAKDVGFVTLRLLAFAEDKLVAQIIESLDWSDAEVLKQSAVLAQHLWLVGQHQRALEFLVHVGTKVRPNALLSYTRGNVLRSLGRLDEAAEYYEYALKLDPYDAHVHRSLAYHQRDPMPGSRVRRIQRAQTQYPAGSMEQAHLLYALFKELDDSGDTEGAWHALEQGAEVVRGKMRHDAAAQAQRFEALIAMPSAGAGAAADAVNLDPVPIFIVGMPRTGTTLLDRILGNHPHVVSAGERNDFDVAISEASDHFYAGGLHGSDWAKLKNLDYAKVGEIYLARMASFTGGSRFFIDKNPQNFFNIGLILRALPNARILCLQRDPMDACFSNLKEMFEGGAYSYSYGLEDLAAHQRGFDALMQHWNKVAPRAVHTVRYEALVRDGGNAVQDILQFCGLQPMADLLDITANLAPVSTASSSQVRQAIHDRSIGAWKRYAAQLEPLRVLLGARS